MCNDFYLFLLETFNKTVLKYLQIIIANMGRILTLKLFLSEQSHKRSRQFLLSKANLLLSHLCHSGMNILALTIFLFLRVVIFYCFQVIYSLHSPF